MQNSLEAVQNGGRVEVSVAAIADSKTGDRGSGIGDREESESVLRTKYSVPSTPTIPAPHFLDPQSQIPNPKLFLSVTDTGPGIPAHIRPHIFDPFFSGREAGRGLGLGLSKAWRIVQLHGGEITALSPPSGGARFTIALPYQRDA